MSASYYIKKKKNQRPNTEISCHAFPAAAHAKAPVVPV